jgi:NADPH:quinone reductase
MTAVRLHKAGGPDVLVHEDVADPTPKGGEALIRIDAVGLNLAGVMRSRLRAISSTTSTPRPPLPRRQVSKLTPHGEPS